ncbi:type II toxin-antitoxin system VapC family toxin [Agrococcus citreus]|uniref:PIN domain-containing protein n=1 Tax=Agrococcus citreus TaxID=84643 RepID=A0ABN1YLQ5_9MICO
MIACFDTSALMPLVLEECGTERARWAWRSASRRVVASVTATELYAALGAASRAGRVAADVLDDALRVADRLLAACEHRVIDRALAADAGLLAAEERLRGYDAIQCAVGLELRAAGAVGVAGDRALLDAWSGRGLQTIDILAS